MEQGKRLLMMMDKALHITDDVDRLHVSRKGGRVIACIQNRVDATIKRLEEYGRRLIIVIKNNADNTSINRTKITRKEKSEEKQTVRTFQATNERNLI